MIDKTLLTKIRELDLQDQRLLLLKLAAMLPSGDQSPGQAATMQLVAYVEADKVMDMEQLRSFLKLNLPSYMIPTSIRLVDGIPRLPNGKVNKKDLIDSVLGTSLNSPKNEKKPPAEEVSETAATLIEIWQDVLNFSPVSVWDNFFEIGGDSILSIQIMAKARKAGIALKPNDLFIHQTIAELATHIGQEKLSLNEDAEPDGEVGLTPMQHWFFESQNVAPHYWNHVYELAYIGRTPLEKIKKVLVDLVSYHDALRLSFFKDGEFWRARLKSLSDDQILKETDLSSVEDLFEQNNLITSSLIRDQKECKLERGGLFRALYFKCGTTQENRLILIAHHLLVDLVSWHLLFMDIKNGLLHAGNEDQSWLSGKTRSIKAWSREAVNWAKSDKVLSEMPFWRKQVSKIVPLPIAPQDSSRIFPEAQVVKYNDRFGRHASASFLNYTTSVGHLKSEHLLITSLVSAICEIMGTNSLCIGLERIGRKLYDSPLDFSQTIGWLSAYFPINFEFVPDETASMQLKRTRETLNSIPNGGMGYGLLRYLNGDPSIKNELSVEPSVVFNFLGVTDQEATNRPYSFQFIRENSRDPRCTRAYALEVNIQVYRGELQIDWEYVPEVLANGTIQSISKRFKANLAMLNDHLQGQDSPEYSPEDFPEVDLSQKDLDNLLSDL